MSLVQFRSRGAFKLREEFRPDGGWSMPGRAKVAMIGDGNVGSALTKGLTRAGYDVQAVGRVPSRVRELAEWGDIIVLAVPFGERENAVEEMGDTIEGKPLVDVTNALAGGSYAGGVDKSGAEQLQEMARKAKVIKAFNTAFAPTMSTGQAHGERITAFIAGDDAEAKGMVQRMATDIGFDAVDAGPLQNARWLEALGMLNIQLAYAIGMGNAIGTRLIHDAKPQRRP